MTVKDQIVQALVVAIHSMGSIDQTPAHAIKLAQICAAWSELEHMMVLAYSGILQTPYPVAKHALHNTTNAVGRAKMVRSACAEFPPSDDFQETLSKVLERVQKLAAKRAQYVHGRWVVRGDGKVFIIRPNAAEHSPEAMLPVTVQEMQDLIDKTTQARKDLEVLVDQTRPLPTMPESISLRSKHIVKKRDQESKVQREFEAYLESIKPPEEPSDDQP